MSRARSSSNADHEPDSDSTGESLASAIDDVSNVLYLSSRGGQRHTCADLLAGPGAGADRLFGVVRGRPDGFLDRCETATAVPPSSTRVLSIDDGEPAIDAADGRGGSTVEVVDPTAEDAVTTAVRESIEEAAAAEGELSLCFDSVDWLLDHIGLQRSFNFLDTVTGRLSRAGATAHFHVDPDEHDRRTFSALSTTFDAVVRSPGSGGDGHEVVWKRVPDDR